MSKPKAPPPPDYAAAARETAAGNVDAVRAQTAANRINQVTPYGSLTYTQNTGRTFNQAAYDAAMQNYYNQLSNPQQSSTPDEKGMFWFNGQVTKSKQGQKPVMPNEADFWSGGNPDGGWTATQTLSPDQQKILEQNTRLEQGLLGTAEKGLGYVDKLLENPTIDESKLAQMPIQGQSVQDAIFSRLTPQLERRRGQLENQLANQGITRGSEAWNNAMTDQGQQENDLMTQAALQGINTGLTARQQGMQEQAYMQDRPLNVVNALRTGNQVQGPQFVNAPQQGFAPGPDLLGAANSQYQANLGAYNAKAAQQGGLMGGLFSLGGAALGSPWLFR